jgi:hypothetical protein
MEEIHELLKIAKQNGMLIALLDAGYNNASSSTLTIAIAENADVQTIKETIIRHFWKVQGRPKVGGGVYDFDFPGKNVAKQCIDYFNNLPA